MDFWFRKIKTVPVSALFIFIFFAPHLYAQDAREIVEQAIEYWRGTSSFIEATMTVHRPEWERSMSFAAWLKGSKNTLVRFTAPAKDAGNASLSKNEETWTFTPKINKIIKIPASMMHQSWMGSDLSYSDLSKDADVIDDYNHNLIGEEKHQGKKVHIINSIPKESAATVWGKEVLKIREDHIIVERQFFDQDLKLVKQLRALEVSILGGRLYATKMRMEKLEEEDEWTEVHHTAARFGIEIPDNFFTLSNLSNPRALP